MKSMSEIVADKITELEETEGGVTQLEEIRESWNGRRVPLEVKARDLDLAIKAVKAKTTTSAQQLQESVKELFGVDDASAGCSWTAGKARPTAGATRSETRFCFKSRRRKEEETKFMPYLEVPITVLQGDEARELLRVAAEAATAEEAIAKMTKERLAREPRFVPDEDCLASMRRDRNTLGMRAKEAAKIVEALKPELAQIDREIAELDRAFGALASLPKSRQRDQAEAKMEKAAERLAAKRAEVASRLERSERMAESCSRLVAKIDAVPDWIRLTAMEEGLPLDPRRMKKKGAGEDFGFAGARNSAGL